MPPRPTAENWRGSPTITILQALSSASRARAASFGVDTVPASSTTTVDPRGRSYTDCGDRSGRECSYSSLSNVSAATAVSVASTSAAALPHCPSGASDAMMAWSASP